MKLRAKGLRALAWSAALLACMVLPCRAIAADGQFLDPDVAFPLVGVVRGPSTIELRFDIAPGYYLYRRAFAFSASGATLGKPRIPPGQAKFDETFGKTLQTHRGSLRIELPLTHVDGPFKLSVVSQGCADAGLCYPPMTRSVAIDPQLLRSSGVALKFN